MSCYPQKLSSCPGKTKFILHTNTHLDIGKVAPPTYYLGISRPPKDHTMIYLFFGLCGSKLNCIRWCNLVHRICFDNLLMIHNCQRVCADHLAFM